MPAEPYKEFLCQADLAWRLLQSNGLYVSFALLLLTPEQLVRAQALHRLFYFNCAKATMPKGSFGILCSCFARAPLARTARGCCPLCQCTIGARRRSDGLVLGHWNLSQENTSAGSALRGAVRGCEEQEHAAAKPESCKKIKQKRGKKNN